MSLLSTNNEKARSPDLQAAAAKNSGLDSAESFISAEEALHHRVFLVVVDDTNEVHSALRFACRRARNTGGRVALLSVIKPPEFQHWMFVGRMMEEEAREDAEQRLHQHAALIHTCTSDMPELMVREGDTREELFKLLEEDPRISVLVLGAGNDKEGPGPLIKAVTGKFANRIKIPVTIVPGNLSDEEIDSLT